jgi:hypothetical protein
MNSTAGPALFLNEKPFNGKNSSTQIRTDGMKIRKALKQDMITEDWDQDRDRVPAKPKGADKEVEATNSHCVYFCQTLMKDSSFQRHVGQTPCG